MSVFLNLLDQDDMKMMPPVSLLVKRYHGFPPHHMVVVQYLVDGVMVARWLAEWSTFNIISLGFTKSKLTWDIHRPLFA